MSGIYFVVELYISSLCCILLGTYGSVQIHLFVRASSLSGVLQYIPNDTCIIFMHHRLLLARAGPDQEKARLRPGQTSPRLQIKSICFCQTKLVCMLTKVV